MLNFRQIRRNNFLNMLDPCNSQCTKKGEICELNPDTKKPECRTVNGTVQLCLYLFLMVDVLMQSHFTELLEQCGSDFCAPISLCLRGRCVCPTIKDCNSRHNEAVCGSDKVTYPNYCHLQRTVCSQTTHVYLSRNGSCNCSGGE